MIDSTIMERCSLSGGSYGERGETPYKELARRLGKMWRCRKGIRVVDDENDNFKNNWFYEQNKQLIMFLWTKQRASRFLVHFLFFDVHILDEDVKLPNAKFYGGREHTRTNFSFVFWIRINSLGIPDQETSRRFDKLRGSKSRDAIKFEKTAN